MKLCISFLFLVLFAHLSIQSTLYVDTVEPNNDSVDIPYFNADESEVTFTSTGRFQLLPSADVEITTEGPVHLAGSFISLDSDGVFSQTAEGTITMDATDAFTVITNDFNITAGNDISITTIAKELEINVGRTVEAVYDVANITGAASVHLNSGGGEVEIFTDHTITSAASTTNIFGENRITIDALFDITFHADNFIDNKANVIDFDTLGDFRISSSTANVHFQAGSDLIVESLSSHFSSVEGIDISSLHGDIYASSGRDFIFSSITIDYEVRDDASFYSNNGPITIDSSFTFFEAENSFQIDASHLSITSSGTISVVNENTYFDSHQGSIQVTSQTSDYYSFDYMTFSANMINSSSTNLFMDIVDSSRDIEFRSTEEAESYFSIVSSDSIVSGTDDFIGIYSGSIDAVSNRIYMRSFLDLNISAEHKTFDFVSMKSNDISFIAGRNEFISANIGSIEASTSISFSSSNLLSINSSDSRGTTSYSASNQLNFTSLIRSVFGSTDDMSFNAWNFNFDGNANSQFSATIGNFENYAFDIGVGAEGSVSASAADGVEVTSNGMLIQANTATYTAPQFDFWTNARLSVTGFQITFNVDGDLDFISFDSLTIDSLDNLNSPIIDFESNERIELNTENIIASSVLSFTIESAFGSDIVWSGAQYVDQATAINDWTAPESVYNSFGSVSWTTTGQISFETLEEHNMFISFTDFAVNTPLSDQYYNALGDYLFFGVSYSITSADDTMFTATGDILGTFSNAVFTTDGAFTAQSTMGDLSFITDNGIDVTTSAWSVTANNNAQIVSSGNIDMIATNGNTVYNVEDLSLTSTALTADVDNGITFLGATTSITLSGDFIQQGGSIAYTSDANSLFSQDTLDVNSIIDTTFSIGTSLTFDASSTDSLIRFQSMDYLVSSDVDIDFLGGDITITSNRTQPIIFASFDDTNIITANNESFSWISRWDIDAQMANFTVWAFQMDERGNSISFTTTHDKGDFVVFSKSGWINFESLDSQTYYADFIELFASGDLFFNTSLALSPNTGGISFITDGFYHNPKVGDNTGITFTTTGVDGFIYLNAPIGGLTFYSGYDMSVNSFEGFIDVLAYQNMIFGTDRNLLISSNDELTFLAEIGDVTFITLNGSTELRAYSNISLSAATNIYLENIFPIEHPNQRAFEFSANSGHIEILADSDSDVEYTADGEFYIQSAETTSQYGNRGVYYNAFTGEYLASSKTGIKLMVQNGDLNVNASESIITSSANNWDIFVTSGQNFFWNALTKNIDVAAAENVTIRTEREDVLFQTLVGNIFMDSTGQIRIESDGTDDNPGSSGVDGTFVIAPNIDVYATDAVFIESEALVTIGANTKPVVKLEAGGDAAASGLDMTAEGNIHFNIQEDWTVTSGGSLYMNALKQFDISTTGSILVATTGTDASGKDFIVRTQSEMDVNSQLALITGEEKATIESFELITLITNGTDPITDAIKILSSNDFYIDVDGRTDVNGNSTLFTIEDTYNFLILGDLGFVSSGEINIYGDTVVDLIADTYLTIKSTGSAAQINFNTLGSNSDITIETEDRTSPIIFKTFGVLSYTSTEELEFSTTGPQVFVAYDNIPDGVDDGDITLTAASDFSMNGDSIILEGAKGIRFTSQNKADIVLQSAGIMSVLARDDILFESLGGKMTISATSQLTFESHEGNAADFNIQSTRDVYLSAFEYLFKSGNDFSIDAGNTVDFTEHEGIIVFITRGADADISFSSDIFTITSEDTTFIGGNVYFDAAGTALYASNQTNVFTTGSHKQISYISENDQLLITASNSIVFEGYFSYYDDIDYFHKGEGFLDWTASGSNPTFGYGILLNVTQNNMFIETFGNLAFLSTDFSMNSIDDNIIFTSSYAVDDQQYSTSILTTGTDGKLFFNSSTNLIIDSSDNIEITAATQINFYPYLSLTFTATGYSSDNADIGRGFGGLIASLHPNGDIYFNTTDFLTGDITVDSSIIEVFGERGLAFHLQDDDDTEFVGEFQIQAPVVSLNGKNSGLVRSIGGGDIVFSSNQAGGQLHLHAGDDIFFGVTNEFHIGDLTDEPNIFFDARGTLGFTSSNSNVVIDADDYDLEFSDDAIVESDEIIVQAGDDITFSAGSQYSPYTEMRVISQLGTIFFDTPLLTVRTQRNRYVDFVDGLILASVANTAFNSYTNQPYTSGALNRWFFYETVDEKFCVVEGDAFRCFSTRATNMVY